MNNSMEWNIEITVITQTVKHLRVNFITFFRPAIIDTAYI